MAKGYGNIAEFLKKDNIRILLLGRDNHCKCLVGNKIIQFDHFQPDRSIYEEISLELGAHEATVINIQKLHPLSLRKIQEHTDLSSECMPVFVLQPGYDNQRDVKLFEALRRKCGDKILENTLLLLFSDTNKRSARPDDITDPHIQYIYHQCQKKLCHFNTNMESNDFMKQLMKCSKTVPEMQINNSERSHRSTFAKNEISEPRKAITYENASGPGAYPSISGQRQEGSWTDRLRRVGSFRTRHPNLQTRFSSVRTRSRSYPSRQGRSWTNGEDQTAISRKDTMTIVLLGQTGSGKSATGNTILRKQYFESHASSVPVTQKCQMEEETVCGKKVRVIDTPDFFDESLRNHQKHIQMCKQLSQPGPDAYVLVMELGRFTDGERTIVQNLQRVFGEDVVNEIIILFTSKEKLGEKTIREYIKNTHPHLQQLIRICGSRCLAFNNNDHKDRQFQTLLDMVSDMKGQNGCTDICERDPQKESKKKDCTIM